MNVGPLKKEKEKEKEKERRRRRRRRSSSRLKPNEADFFLACF